MRRELESRASALNAAARAVFRERRSRTEQLSGRLQALSPLNILERGYALVFDESGNLIKSFEQAAPGKEVTARLHRGKIRATVTGAEE
jgi:exodeoxyribonuclease VII large subunit